MVRPKHRHGGRWGGGAAWPRAVLVCVLAGAAAVAPARSAAAYEIPDFTPEQMGGTLHRCISAEPQTLNPITGKDLYERYVNEYIFEYLLIRDLDTGKLQGMLAKDWDISPDGLTLTFHLKPEACFSDGHPLTAEDVVFTYNTVMDPKIDARSLASYLLMCESCTALDPHTVRFVWKQKYFKILESSGNLFPILPKHLYEKNVQVSPGTFQKGGVKHFNDLVQGLVGSGPYKFERWNTTRDITLVRNEKYWGKPPAFNRIVFHIIQGEQASVQAFMSGDLDDLAITGEWLNKLKDDPRRGKQFELYRYDTPANGYSFFAWNHAKHVYEQTADGQYERVEKPHPLFHDWRVRRAMTHLIAREKLLKYLYFDVGQVATGTFWPKSPQADPDIKPWPYDPVEAHRLLAEAGWKDRDGDGWLENEKGEPFKFEWTLPAGHQGTLDMARIVKEEFRRAGIEVTLRFVDWPTFVRTLDQRDFDAITLAWGGGGVESDPYQIWHSDAIANQGNNFISFRNAEADRLIEEARRELDPVRRNALFHEFDRLLHRLQPYTFFIARESVRMVSTRLRNVKVHDLGMETQEWWIPADLRRDRGAGEAEETRDAGTDAGGPRP